MLFPKQKNPRPSKLSGAVSFWKMKSLQKSFKITMGLCYIFIFLDNNNKVTAFLKFENKTTIEPIVPKDNILQEYLSPEGWYKPRLTKLFQDVFLYLKQSAPISYAFNLTI